MPVPLNFHDNPGVQSWYQISIFLHVCSNFPEKKTPFCWLLKHICRSYLTHALPVCRHIWHTHTKEKSHISVFKSTPTMTGQFNILVVGVETYSCIFWKVFLTVTAQMANDNTNTMPGVSIAQVSVCTQDYTFNKKLKLHLNCYLLK